MELSDSVLDILDLAGLDVTRDGPEAFDKHGPDGDILQRWRLSRNITKPAEESSDFFLNKYLGSKKDQDTQTIQPSFRSSSTSTDERKAINMAVQCQTAKCREASVQTTARQHRRSVALQFSSAKNHKECQTEAELDSEELTVVSSMPSRCAPPEDVTFLSACPDATQKTPSIAELEENFSRILAEIEDEEKSPQGKNDPILEFLLQRREEITRDVQLIDQALASTVIC
ncbi:Oidioi.mRNA.OKI2018_I69.PAR.g11700.t1.cds [Oikopleura dioica]|uniref:Oidioi.mRNA.OKI2018_I69.PAR.g11700.t1.cds n=1 Tax=Oikopleura dioica TaxID=34765 RepID=A0ABN7RXK4_OIKDI|nr:Oidioi.mRNA.OKI2018_I69.PAR.g11700.t1.cds [Oikopleura dioica]